MDTKAAELNYAADCLRRLGKKVTTVDVSTGTAPSLTADVLRDEVRGCTSPLPQDRGEAIGQMSECLKRFLRSRSDSGEVAGVLGLGGSGGTALITAALRHLPIGIPKLMVSTVASGNTAPYVDCSDIIMMPSIVDIAGLNVVSRGIMAQAAAALASMVSAPPIPTSDRPCVGMTMFGVTTTCVTAVREAMEARGRDALVFHAVGTGGRTMEKLVENGMIRGVLDVTTTEVADEIVGGVFRAGPDRFNATIRAEVPFLVSVGALDMVNFGSLESVPQQYRNRNLHQHNAQVTLMRTSPDENIRIARWMAERLNRTAAPMTLLIPAGGVSALDAPGMPFHDPDADEALFSTLEREIRPAEGRTIVRLPCHINDAEFSDAIVSHFERLEDMHRSA